MKKIIFAVFLFATFIFAVEVKSFKMTTNSANIASGDIITIVAELSTNGAANTDIPQFLQSDDYSVLSANKSQSSSTSISMINGKTTTERTVTTRFLYQIRFNSQKTTTLPPLSLTIDGKKYATNSITFNIGEEKPAEQSPVSVRFIRERSALYKGEQAKLTIRVQVRAGSNAQLTNDGYSRFINELREKLSEKFTLVQFSNSAQEKQEIINGMQHIVYDFAFNLVPLDTGKIYISPIPLSYVITERGRGRDPFDDFFGGGFFSNTRQMSASASSPSLSYAINEIPKPMPKDFKGIIGEVKLSGNLSVDSVAAGEAVTLKVTMSGKMSSALMGEIELEKNPDLDIFPPEREVKQDTTANGITTTKRYSWMIIPKKEGEYNIPVKEIVWFDPSSAKFKTASAGNFKFKSSAGNYEQKIQARRYLTQSEIATLGDDIRYIKTQISTNDIEEKFSKKHLFTIFAIIWAIALILILIKLKTVIFPKNIHEEKRSKAYSAAIREISKKNISEISAILKYLSTKTGKECGSMKYDDLEKLLESRKVAKTTCEKLTKYFRDVEMSRYAANDSQKEHVKEGIEILKSIDREIK
jgi:TusA-related sulfurtransferase